MSSDLFMKEKPPTSLDFLVILIACSFLYVFWVNLWVTTYLCPQIYVFLVNLWVTTYLKKRETTSALVPSFQEIGQNFIKINKNSSSVEGEH